MAEIHEKEIPNSVGIAMRTREILAEIHEKEIPNSVLRECPQRLFFTDRGEVVREE